MGNQSGHRLKDQIHLSDTFLAFQKPELCGNCFIISFFSSTLQNPLGNLCDQAYSKHRLSYPTGIQCLLKAIEFGKKSVWAPSKKEFSNSYHYCIDSDLAIPEGSEE